MGSKPITQKAKCKYESDLPKMEVTVDAKGTQPASFPSTSPAKQLDLVAGSAKVYGSGKPRQITVPGATTTTENYTGGGRFKNKEEKDWFDQQIKQRTDAGMSAEEALQDYRNTFGIGEKKTVTTTTPDRTIEVEGEPWSGELMVTEKGIVKQPWEVGQQKRADKKVGKDLFKQLRRSGMSREDAKKERDAFLLEQARTRVAEQKQAALSQKTAGSSYVRGQRGMLQSELGGVEAQKSYLQEKAKYEDSTNPYGYSEAYGRGIQIGTPKGTPKIKSPAYKMNGFGSKTYKK